MSAELHGDDYARGARHDFAVNVSADPRPEWLDRAIVRGIAQLGSYPVEHAAVAAIARRHARDPADVVLLSGAADGFTRIAQALRPRRPLVVHPSFTEPERALREAGLRPRRHVLPAPFELEATAVLDDADLVIVGNPTNPTGVLHRRASLIRLCRPGRTTVVDEAFMDYVPGEPETLAGDGELPGLVVVRSLTKILGVPGVRAGYLLAPAPLADRIRRAGAQWSVNAVALGVIEAAAVHPGYVEEQARITAARRAELAAALERIEAITTFPGAANFLLLELPDAVAVHERLRASHGIATRPGWTFPGLDHRHLRVTVRGEPLDAMLAGALAQATR